MSEFTEPTIIDGHLTDNYLMFIQVETEEGRPPEGIISVLVEYIRALKDLMWRPWTCPKCRVKLTQEQKTVGMWHCPSCRTTVMESMGSATDHTKKPYEAPTLTKKVVP